MYSFYVYLYISFLRINHHSSVTGTVDCIRDDDVFEFEWELDVENFRFGFVL